MKRQVEFFGGEIKRFAQIFVRHFEELTASLKRCPDTKPEFFRRL
jgi:hypothetical protein